MKRLAVGAALILGVAFIPFAGADEDFEALQKEYQKAQQDWGAKLESFKDDKGEIDWEKAPKHPSSEFAPRFKACAEQHLDDGKAMQALCWLINYAGHETIEGDEQPVGKWAVAMLTKHCAADPAIAGELARLCYARYSVGADPLVELFEKVLSDNKEKDARAWASFSLGYTHYQGGQQAGSEESDSGVETGLKLFRKTVKEFAGTRAAERSEGFIFEAENLQIGMKAPEIVGTNVSGEEIKLSQFHGQVVVIDFWGFW